MAMRAPAWDQRIRASVSNCRRIPYRDSFARDAGFQADFVVPDFASAYDVEDVLSGGVPTVVAAYAAYFRPLLIVTNFQPVLGL